MSLSATIREYMSSVELTTYVIPLELTSGTITLGRTATCTHQLGKTLGTSALGISKIHATIFVVSGEIYLLDGGEDLPSANGIYCGTDRLASSIKLIPGLELTLFRQGLAKVSFTVTDTEDFCSISDTYTGRDLTSILQTQMEILATQVNAMHEQVEALDVQLAQRLQIDAAQEARLQKAEKRLNGLLAIGSAIAAVIILINGWTGGTLEDRKQWSSTFQSVVLLAATYYFKSKQDEQGKPKS